MKKTAEKTVWLAQREKLAHNRSHIHGNMVQENWQANTHTHTTHDTTQHPHNEKTMAMISRKNCRKFYANAIKYEQLVHYGIVTRTQRSLKSNDDIKLSIHLIIIKRYFCADKKERTQTEFMAVNYGSSYGMPIMIRTTGTLRPATSSCSTHDSDQMFAVLLFADVHKESI